MKQFKQKKMFKTLNYKIINRNLIENIKIYNIFKIVTN